MTNLQNCLGSCSIYVGTYTKYNNGLLLGKWLNLSDYSDYNELLEAMKELHKDEHNAEFMFQDYENCSFFEKLGLINENFLSAEIYEISRQIDNSCYDIEIFEAYVDCIGKLDFQSIYNNVMNYYIGEYSSDETFAQSILEEDILDNLPNYIYVDWEATSRNLMYDYFESNRHYFKS
ncbi:antirestriction protein ArdA [Chryseobacterium sp. MHB01]|uniref:antirestriction protein ArdA n=1 Tax=Chryseobacterium sp. MHB01 TaxID=3109433 RepID=UPI002AFF3643|nr:antirestriction protein ArdA [Chryseobacterium sp. MHB01]MEA1847520.1 antirestriction protein ArdA [Chryseobacterium sp. MHB01]